MRQSRRRNRSIASGRVIELPEASGLHHRYVLEAA
jgi:hypothetical protein